MKNSIYKTYARTQRALTVEETFARGMQYSDAPMEEGYCRVLVNYDFKDKGVTLMPRGGMRVLPNTSRAIATQLSKQRILHTEQTIDLLDDSLHRYALCVQDTDETETALANATVLVQDGTINNVPNLIRGRVTDTDGKYLVQRPPVGNALMHMMPMERLRPIDVHTVLNDVTYLPARINGQRVLGRLLLERAATSAPYTVSLDAVTPKEIYPSEAANYGYNMLKASPYAFVDTQQAALSSGLINIVGVLPYEDATCSNVLLSARVGQYVTFRAVCEWPNTTDTFKFKWEMRDLDSEASTVLSAPTDTSISYHFDGTNAVSSVATAHVIHTVQPAYKHFAITVTAYASTALDKAVATMVLAAYTLTDTPQDNKALQLKTYDLTTMQGMCTWRHHIVLWGVENAPNILFVSDTNEPAYFPYPNNCHITSGRIIACVPHLDNLLVFTENQLLQCAWAEDGMSYTVKTIQDNLRLTDADAQTVRTVANMIYFKSGNYYYMIVPTMSAATLTSSLTLAPISSSITSFLDNFYTALYEIVDSVYNPSSLLQTPLQENEEFAIRLSSFNNYLDGSCVRNVYKCRLVVQNTVTYDTMELCTFDFILNYDTLLRTWSCYIYESNDTDLIPYIRSVADKTMFLNLTNTPTQLVPEEGDEQSGFVQVIELVQQDPMQIGDTFTLERGHTTRGRHFKNWQYLDTGYREHDSHINKRYRELQFGINNTSGKTLLFGTAFILDDAARKELFAYRLEHVVDDIADPDYGQIVFERDYANPTIVSGDTILGPGEDLYPGVTLNNGIALQHNTWALSVSRLSHGFMRKVRLLVSGKGYAPRTLLLSFNEQLYELLSTAWVSRTMNGR